MASTTYQAIPEELWQQGDPPIHVTPLALVRWEEVPDEGGDTQNEYSIMCWELHTWLDYDGYAPEPTYPDTVRYIVLKP